ncbi:MAG: glycerol-3-phosphate acyltransferase [Dehalococcoidia bacterium]
MNEIIFGVSFSVAAYLVGAIPTAHILGRRAGLDIRSMGSGNVGALNALRSLGNSAAVFVFVVDIGKAALVMLGATVITDSVWIGYVVAFALMVGHNFPVYIGFRGGKGAAVMTGISFVVVPYLALLSFPVLLVGYFLFRSPVWAMFMTFISINVLSIATGQPLLQVVLFIVLTLLVGATHLSRTFHSLWPAIKALNFRRIGHIE